jgi:hypothetical protein
MGKLQQKAIFIYFFKLNLIYLLQKNVKNNLINLSHGCLYSDKVYSYAIGVLIFWVNHAGPLFLQWPLTISFRLGRLGWQNRPMSSMVNSMSLPIINGTARFNKCKQLFEYQHLPLLRDIWWSKFYSIFKCCSFIQHQCWLDICGCLRQLFSCTGV